MVDNRSIGRWVGKSLSGDGMRSELAPSGRPRIRREIRELSRKMSLANPLRGAPRIHGELLKLGLDVSRHRRSIHAMATRRPLPTWRSSWATT